MVCLKKFVIPKLSRPFGLALLFRSYPALPYRLFSCRPFGTVFAKTQFAYWSLIVGIARQVLARMDILLRKRELPGKREVNGGVTMGGLYIRIRIKANKKRISLAASLFSNPQLQVSGRTAPSLRIGPRNLPANTAITVDPLIATGNQIWANQGTGMRKRTSMVRNDVGQ